MRKIQMKKNARPTRERVNNRRNRRNANEEVTSESAVNFANVSDDNRQEEKAEKPVAERRHVVIYVNVFVLMTIQMM